METIKDYSRSVTGGSDEVMDILCEPCEQDGRKTEAEGFCVDCSEYLCGQCCKNHKLFKAFRNHVVNDKTNMPQTVIGIGVKDSCVTKCDHHEDKIVEYFCESCDELGCTTCITLDHRQCEEVEHIPKMVKATNMDEKFQEFLKEIDKISEQVQERKNTLKSLSGTLDNTKKIAKEELTKQRAEVKKFFDDLEKEMVNKIDEISTRNTETLTATSEESDTMEKYLADFKSNVSIKQRVGQHCEAFITVKNSARIIEKKFQNMQKSENEILKYKVLTSPKITEMMKNITMICRLETETVLLNASVIQASSKLELPMTTSPSTIQDKSRETRLDASNLVSLTLNTEINIINSNDKPNTYARGLSMVNDHFVVVADRPNNSVKTVEIRNKRVTSELVMDVTVWNVTKVDSNKVAVGTKSGIHFLSVSTSGLLSMVSAFCTKMTCFDIVYSKQKLIVAQGSFVEIFSMQGEVLKTFETDYEGKPMFTSCYGLAISNDHETIYISDNTRSTVTSLTLDGKVKSIYTDSDLKNPWGITTDNAGNVYVCSCGTKSIHQLDADCTKLQVFQNMPGGSVTYTDTNKLIVGGVGSLWIYDLL